MTIIPGGVTAALGFTAAGIHCGVRKNKEKRDLALIFCEKPCAAAAVYTTNRVKAAPIYVTMENLENGMARAILANSGNANACAPNGMENARRACAALAKRLGIAEDEIIVNSTGVIGMPLPIEVIEAGIPALADSLSRDGTPAAEAIMTTDLTKKEFACQITLGGRTVTLGGIAKGSGMIKPNLATMMAFVTTDCAITSELLHEALAASCGRTYNRISVDGDTSTNDMSAILASGLAGNPLIAEKNADYDTFVAALDAVNLHLAREIARDGEGATKLVTCRVTGARSEEVAAALSMAVISSSLVKAAMFGADANWGRVLCAMGYSKAPFRPEFVDISFSSPAGTVQVCAQGRGLPFDETLAKEILTQKEITILADCHEGDGQAECYGCDLTYDYVKINGDYRT